MGRGGGRATSQVLSLCAAVVPTVWPPLAQTKCRRGRKCPSKTAALAKLVATAIASATATRTTTVDNNCKSSSNSNKYSNTNSNINCNCICNNNNSNCDTN
jgi:hypothetical protein